jgi:polysaccharide pyruvyl transferase WcaK-like protein
MHDIMLAGAYGQANPGDEALLEAFLTHLDPARVVVTSQTPDATAARWGCAAMAPSGTEVARWLRHGRHLVIGGGTIFKTLHPASGRRPNSLLVRTLGLLRAARIKGITTSLVGVGAADLPSVAARRMARSIARHADLLIVRDEESASVLAAAGVPMPIRVGADAAWTLFDHPRLLPSALANRVRPITAPADGRQHPRVLVALSHLAGDADLSHHFADALNQVDSNGNSITLQPWQHDPRAHDQQLAAELTHALGPHVDTIAPPRDLYEATGTAADFDLVIGLRFHSLVAAAAAGTPFVAISHEPKLAGIAARFDQLAVPPHASAAVLARTITLGIDQPTPDPVIAQDEIARAGEAFRLLGLVITDGATADDIPRARLALSAGGARW